MMEQFKRELTESIRHFKLPRYSEIPNVGLFLEQSTKYISDFLEPLPGITITSSMISNYVKKKLVSNPVKKQYDRDQIAYLIFIAIAKSVLSLENIQVLIHLQQKTCSSQRAYDYFCRLFEDLLMYVFGLRDSIEDDEESASQERIILRNTVIALVHKVYLETSLGILSRQMESGGKPQNDEA